MMFFSFSFSLQSLATPRHDEWSRFVRTLADIKAVTADADDDDVSR